MDLRSGDGGSAGLFRPLELVDWAAEARLRDLAEPLRELPRGAARDVRLARARIVENLPGADVPGDLRRRAEQQRREQREVPGRDHADVLGAGGRVDLREV